MLFQVPLCFLAAGLFYILCVLEKDLELQHRQVHPSSAATCLFMERNYIRERRIVPQSIFSKHSQQLGG